MSRAALSRPLEPLVAILWGLFLMWTAWVAVVWTTPIGAAWLGFAPGQPPPPDADLRRAVLLMAAHADVAWLALAVMNVHLVVTRAHGLRTARIWLAIAAGGSLLLGLANAATGVPFGWLAFGAAMGAAPFGVAVGWILLWAFLVIGARGAVLWACPRASHSLVALLTAAAVLLTVVNLDWPVRFIRGWWAWHSGAARAPATVPWSNWAAWALAPWLMACAMREKDVLSAVAPRSARPLAALALLNALALAVRARAWLQG